MSEDTTHWTNEFGGLRLRSKTDPNLVAERSYWWCDLILIIDESQGRLVVDTMKYSELDKEDWEHDDGAVADGD